MWAAAFAMDIESIESRIEEELMDPTDQNLVVTVTAPMHRGATTA